MGSVFLIIILTIIGLIITLVTIPCNKFGCCKRFNGWLKKKLQWNWVIRILLESTLELGFSLILMIQFTRPAHLEQKYLGSYINYGIGILLALSLLLLPCFILLFYCKYFDLLDKDEFKDKYGTVYDGLNTAKRSSLVY